MGIASGRRRYQHLDAAVVTALAILAAAVTAAADPGKPLSPHCGSNNVLLCRGGREQGAACTSDSHCSGGICTILGRPRRCRVEAFCNVSKQVPCADNRDCPLFPFKDPADFCPHIVAMKDCTKDEDCGEGGKCMNGVTQCEYEAPHVSSGLPGDLVGDWVIGQCTLEDGVWNTATATSLATAVGVEFDRAAPKRLYVTDFFRVTAFEGDRIEKSSSAATVVIGQATLDFRLDHVGHRLPGDLTVGGFYSQAERTLLRQFDRKARAVSTPDMQALWITDVKRLGRYPRTAKTNEAMDLVLGYTDFAETRVVATNGQIEHASDVDAQRRCVGGASIGTPCSKDPDCPGSECATTLAVADCGYNRVAVWRRPPQQNGQAIDVCLGQPDCTAVARNRGKQPAADSLSCARGLAFDSKGNLWVADADNNRLLRFDKGFTQESHAAAVVFGQPGFETNEPGTSATQFRTADGPGAGIGIDSKDNLALADVGNSRVLFIPVPYKEATRVIGASDFKNSTTMRSTDGVLCDRLTSPRDVAFDDKDNLWVADSNSARALRFKAGFAATNAAADVIQGQKDCRTSHYLEVGPKAFGRGHGHGAAVMRTGPYAGLGCFGDSQDNRILCWRDVKKARSGMPPADFVLGQMSMDAFLPNRPERSASTLEQPFLFDFVGDKTPRLVVADRDNSRVLGFPVDKLRTGAAADLVLGQQGSFSTFACPLPQNVNATTLCHPTSARGDAEGNIWVADRDSGRVLLFCFGAAGTADGICQAKNRGDAAADLVLGQPKLTTPFDPKQCDSPTAASLCQPYDVVSDPKRKRVIVSDQKATSNAGRVLVYSYPLADGMKASAVIGIPDGRLDTYEPSKFGACSGGAGEGKPCSYIEFNGVPARTSRMTCVGGDAPDEECSKDGDCKGGTCGCPAPGVCDYSRSLASVTSVDAVSIHPDLDILYAGKGPHMLEYLGPLKSGMAATRVGGFTTPHNFYRGSTGYTECQWDRLAGGLAFDAERNLYVPQGGAEDFAAVLILKDPAASIKAAGAKR